MTIGERLRSLRGRQSLAELGKELDVSATQLSKIETDQSKPSFELAEKICERYDVTLDWLMRGIDNVIPSVNKILSESDPNMITISKDEFIELQRKALKQEEAKVKKLEEKVSQLKND